MQALLLIIYLLSDPKNEHSGIDAALNDLQDLLRASIIMLYNQCDTIAVQFKENEMNYYHQYRSARKLIPLTKHTKLRVTITNEIGEPQYNIPVAQNNSSNSSSTGINGEATLYIEVKDFGGKTPVYEFTIGKDKSQIQTGPIEIRKGETVSRTYIMQETGFIIPAPQEENINA